MKKLLVKILIVLTMVNVLPMKKSEAGVIFAGISVLATQVDCGGFALGPTLLSVGFLAGGIKVLTLPRGLGWGITLVALDQKAEVNQSQLTDHFMNKYSFINNREIIHSLTAKMLNRYQELQQVDAPTYVNLDHAEIEETLAPLDLTFEELNLIIDDLN